MTAGERQLWYWQNEMESAHRRRNVYEQGSDEWKHWDDIYKLALKTYRELTERK